MKTKSSLKHKVTNGLFLSSPWLQHTKDRKKHFVSVTESTTLAICMVSLLPRGVKGFDPKLVLLPD